MVFLSGIITLLAIFTGGDFADEVQWYYGITRSVTVTMVYGVTILFWIIYFLIFTRYRNLMNEVNERVEEIERLNYHINLLNIKNENLLKDYNREINQLEDEYHTHMQNQMDILENELQRDVPLNTSMKECPRCAEMIKERAKICRYCNYELV